ncbi:MAG: response regulator transcription factor [Gammaproteobacteria bacterium]|nr:response regulator transcription factor [Gammaproteobacteria bacterium]
MTKQLLLIDDDVKLGELLEEYLSRFNFKLVRSVNPIQGLELISQQVFDLIILDVMLPEIDGFETLRRIRRQKQIPVIMLTARGDTTDRIVGLELGADDYLPKPFEPRELLARINSIIKRSGKNHSTDSSLEFENIEISLEKGQVKVDGIDVVLTSAEFDMLRILVTRPGAVVSRDDLFEASRGLDWDAFNRSIDVTVSRLRAKLGDPPKQPRFIKTVFGRGYQFIAEIQ